MNTEWWIVVNTNTESWIVVNTESWIVVNIESWIVVNTESWIVVNSESGIVSNTIRICFKLFLVSGKSVIQWRHTHTHTYIYIYIYLIWYGSFHYIKYKTLYKYDSWTRPNRQYVKHPAYVFNKVAKTPRSMTLKKLVVFIG